MKQWSRAGEESVCDGALLSTELLMGCSTWSVHSSLSTVCVTVVFYRHHCAGGDSNAAWQVRS